MKNVIFPTLTLALCLFFSCKKEKTALHNTDTQIVSFGQTVGFLDDALSIRFDTANEYRCCCFCDCVWAGSCDVRLAVSGNGIPSQLITLGAPPFHTLPDSALVGPYTIRLTHLSPDSVCHADFSKLDKYKVTLEVNQ